MGARGDKGEYHVVVAQAKWVDTIVVCDMAHKVERVAEYDFVLFDLLVFFILLIICVLILFLFGFATV